MDTPIYGACATLAQQAAASASEAQDRYERAATEQADAEERIVSSLQTIDDSLERLVRAVGALISVRSRVDGDFGTSFLVNASNRSWDLIERLMGECHDPPLRANHCLLSAVRVESDELASWFAEKAHAQDVPTESISWPTPIYRGLLHRYQSFDLMGKELCNYIPASGWYFPGGSSLAGGLNNGRPLTESAVIRETGELSLGPRRRGDRKGTVSAVKEEMALNAAAVVRMAQLLGWILIN